MERCSGQPVLLFLCLLLLFNTQVFAPAALRWTLHTEKDLCHKEAPNRCILVTSRMIFKAADVQGVQVTSGTDTPVPDRLTDSTLESKWGASFLEVRKETCVALIEFALQPSAARWWRLLSLAHCCTATLQEMLNLSCLCFQGCLLFSIAYCEKDWVFIGFLSCFVTVFSFLFFLRLACPS